MIRKPVTTILIKKKQHIHSIKIKITKKHVSQ